MRAVLLASATATTRLGRCWRSPITHGSALVAFERSKLALAAPQSWSAEQAIAAWGWNMAGFSLPPGVALALDRKKLAAFSALGGGFLRFPIGDRRCNRTRASVGNAGGNARPSLTNATLAASRLLHRQFDPSASRETKGPLRAFGEVCQRMEPKNGAILSTSPACGKQQEVSMATLDSPSLYERLGGVYSIATVVDDLIDRVMTDPRLNANPLVDDAHHKVPPAGFKYLVTEMLCWAAGGPQKYTGKDMESSHQHLRITPGEWEAFMDDVAQTLDRCGGGGAGGAEVVPIVESPRRSIVAA